MSADQYKKVIKKSTTMYISMHMNVWIACVAETSQHGCSHYTHAYFFMCERLPCAAVGGMFAGITSDPAPCCDGWCVVASQCGILAGE